MMPLPDTHHESHQRVYGLLILLAVGLTLGRIASAERVNEPSVHKKDGDPVPRPAWPKSRPDPWPTFSSNDRSRWALVRALVDEGTFVVGRRDLVKVLSTPVAGLAASNPLESFIILEAGYAARLRADTGIIFEDGWQSVDKVLHPSKFEYYSTKPPLLSVLAAGGYWVLKNLCGLSIVQDRWTVIPVLLVLLNVLPFMLYLWLLVHLVERMGETEWARYYVIGAASFATMVSPFLISFNNHTIATTSAVVALYAVVRIREDGEKGWFLVAGLAAGFTACNELPALSLAAGLGVYLLYLAPVRTLTLFVPAALLPALALVGLHYLQLGQLRPAYAEFGGSWYQYEGSHWRVPEGVVKRGIDFARRNGETRGVYAFHLLLGHHGWFSLTPIMLLTLAGMGICIAGYRHALISRIALFTFLVSTVVIGFYIADNRSGNYGGWSNGPRWLMWLSPFWLLCMLPVLDELGRSRVGRGFALTLLAVSILSMSYQMWNPWRHPWLYNWMESRGWIAY